MENEGKKTSVKDIIDVYKKAKTSGGTNKSQPEQQKTVEKNTTQTTDTSYVEKQIKETDTDLMVGYETIKLPSNGLFYENGLKELDVEYMTSKDEDLLTTPSLIENGTVLNKLLKRKIKTPNVNVDDLLPGDKGAIILFLRTSSYGPEYDVEVKDPRKDETYKRKVDLFKLEPKEISETPNKNGYFNIDLPIRKKNVVFRLLTSGEEDTIKKTAEELKQENNEEYAEYSTLRLKSSIVSIDGNTDRYYINKFVDAMPMRDVVTLKRKIIDVSPGFDMGYNFVADDGYKFKAYLVIGSDFFFPND